MTGRSPRRPRRSGLILAAIVAGIAAALLPVAAHAATGAPAARCDTAHAGPYSATNSNRAGYFTVTAQAGRVVTRELLVANPSDASCTVTLTPANGRTAVNSGNTYVPLDRSATGGSPASWIGDLPARVTVAARSRAIVPFSVHVPAGTATGQFLAGVMVAPAERTADGEGTGTVSVRVSTQVAVGVAVTVPGELRPALAIPAVRIDSSAPPARTLQIVEVNSGTTWEHPHGTFTARLHGRVAHLPITSGTVLPGGRATLSLGAEQVPAGTYPSRVVLRYGEGQTAVWSGDLTFAEPAVATARNGTVVITEANPWTNTILFLAIGLGALVLFLLFLLLRRRRRDDEDDDQVPAAAA